MLGGRGTRRLLLRGKWKVVGLWGSDCVVLWKKRDFHEGNWCESGIEVTVSRIGAVKG